MEKLTYEAWVRKLLERVSTHLDLAGWTITTEFSEEEKGDTYAEARISSPYLFANVTFYKQAKVEFDQGKVERLSAAIVHELCHTFFDPLHEAMHPFLSPASSPSYMNILEQQTQKLTMVILKTLPKNLIPAR